MWNYLLTNCILFITPISVICEQTYLLNKENDSPIPYLSVPTASPYAYFPGYQPPPPLPPVRYQFVNKYVKPEPPKPSTTTATPSTTIKPRLNIKHMKSDETPDKQPSEPPKLNSFNPFEGITMDAATKNKTTAMMFLASAELALRQLFLVYPEIFANLTTPETIAPKSRDETPRKNDTSSRRFLFSPTTIHNTIVNTNNNENINSNKNSNMNFAEGMGGGSNPYPPGAYPFGPAPFGPGPSQYPMLKFFLESLNKETPVSDTVNRKPVKVCFELL